VIAPGQHGREGFIFVSSPGATTPFHIDPEHNFLLQIRGTKCGAMFDPTDRHVISERELEGFYSGAHPNLVYREGYEAYAEQIKLEPGQGLHFPVVAPHYVRNGDQVSISFSITFRSELSRQRESLYRFNGALRRLGLMPRPVSESAGVDRAKLRVLSAARGLRRLVGRGD